MNSQFQKSPAGSGKGDIRPSAAGPPSSMGETPALHSLSNPGEPRTSTTSIDARDAWRPDAGSDPNRARYGGGPPARSSGSEALLAETQDAVGAAADTAHAATSAIRDAGAEIADVAKEAMRATASAVSAQAAELTANVTEELTATAEAQKERGAEAMHRFAKAVRTAAHELDDTSPQIARQIRAAAGSVDSLCDNLHRKSVGELFNAATDFARSQPAAFFAGAVIAGFAFSRFLKSSSGPTPQRNGGERGMAAPMTSGGEGVQPSAPSMATF